MAKHRHRDRGEELNSKMGGMGNNPFGIDPSQLMGMLGNVDMNKIGAILSSMNKNGFDINSVGNMNNNANVNFNGNNGFDMNSINTLAERLGMNNRGNGRTNVKTQQSNNVSHSSESGIIEDGEDRNIDENMKMLLSLKNIVNEERVIFINKIIELYNKGIFKDI